MNEQLNNQPEQTLEEIINPSKSTEITIIQPKEEDDFEFARENIRQAIQQGQDAMLELADVCKSSGHPRAFEVFAKMMDSIVAANKTLLENKEINQVIAQRDINSDSKKIVNQNLFVGTTAELLKMMEAKNKE